MKNVILKQRLTPPLDRNFVFWLSSKFFLTTQPQPTTFLLEYHFKKNIILDLIFDRDYNLIARKNGDIEWDIEN